MWQHEIVEEFEELRDRAPTRGIALVFGTLIEYIKRAETIYFGDYSRLDGMRQFLNGLPMPPWTDMPSETTLVEWEQKEFIDTSPEGAGLLEQQYPAPKRAVLVRSDAKAKAQTFYSFFYRTKPYKIWEVCMLKKKYQKNQVFTNDMFGLCSDRSLLKRVDEELCDDISAAKMFMEIFNASSLPVKEVPSKEQKGTYSYKVVEYPD